MIFYSKKKHPPSPAHTEVWGHVWLLFNMIDRNLAFYIVIIKMVMVIIMTMYIVIINMSLIINMVMLINLTIYLKMIMKMSMIITIVMMIIMAMRYVWGVTKVEQGRWQPFCFRVIHNSPNVSRVQDFKRNYLDWSWHLKAQHYSFVRSPDSGLNNEDEYEWWRCWGENERLEVQGKCFL